MPDSDITIRSFDCLRSLELQEAELMAAIRRVLRSGQLILGAEGSAFENEFAAWTGADFAVGVGSGTDALILALMAVGVRPGDEVITVANTAVPTASAIVAVGAVPRFVDVNERTLLMDTARVSGLITPATRCLLPVHLYGMAVPMDPLLRLAAEHRLRIVEDCAHAHGATTGRRHVGTLGDIGCFSFYPTKNLGALGDAGMCVTGSPQLADSLRSLRMYGFRNDRIAHHDGRNSRLDEIQAAILRVRLKLLNSGVQRRREIALRYLDGLEALTSNSAAGWQLPTRDAIGEHAFHQFVIRVRNRPLVIQTLAQSGIGCGIHYEIPLHQMPAFQLSHCSDHLPVTESAAARILSLPMYPELTNEEIDRVIKVLCRTAAMETCAA